MSSGTQEGADCSVSWARSREACITSTDILGVKPVTWPPSHVERWVPVNPEERDVVLLPVTHHTCSRLVRRPKVFAEGTLSKLSSEW